MLNNGLLIYIQINVETADIVKCTFDKYLIGKLCDHISDGKYLNVSSMSIDKV